MTVTSASSEISVDGRTLRLIDVEAAARHGATARLADSALAPMAASRRTVEEIVEQHRVVYGVTTGFGSLSNRTVPQELAAVLQANMLRSHAAGAGDPLPTEVVRSALLLRANSLAAGYSGVRAELVELLIACLNAGIHPVVPCQGSLGASGDLAPLAHLALPLIGEGRVELDGVVLPAAEALAKRGLTPLTLEPKEALALINGTQIIASLGTLALLDSERLTASATSIGALSLAVLGARHAPFDERIHQARPHPGQLAVASVICDLLEGAPELPLTSGRIQDPYSLRCIPQIHGGVFDALKPTRATLEIEINAATDNPLIFSGDADEEAVLSGGNFHGHPLALSCDAAKIAIASLGTISERRINILVDGEDRGLPPCLVAEPGVNSGYMIAHYMSAGLVSENRVLAHPSSVDSIPVSGGIEDVNTMGATAARHFRQIVANVETVLAVEALCAAQAADLTARVPKGALGGIYTAIRERVPFLDRDDRAASDDIAAVLALLREGKLIAAPIGEEAHHG